MDEIRSKDCMRLLDEIVALYGPINNRETEYPDGFIKAMFVARYNELIQRHCLDQTIFEKLTDLDGGMDDGDLPKFQKAVAELKLLLLKKGRNDITALEVNDADVMKAGGLLGLGYGLRGAAGAGVKGLAKGGVTGGVAGLGLGYGANALKNKVQRNLETRRLRKEYERANNIYASALPQTIFKAARKTHKPVISNLGKKELINNFYKAKTPIEKGKIAQQMQEYGMRIPYRRNRIVANEDLYRTAFERKVKEDRDNARFIGRLGYGAGGALLGAALAKRIPVLRNYHPALSALGGTALGVGAYNLLRNKSVDDRINRHYEQSLGREPRYM